MSTTDTTGYQIKVSNLSDKTSDCDIRDLFSRHGFDDVKIKPLESYPQGKQPGVEYVGLKEELVDSAIAKLQGESLHNSKLTLTHDFRYHFDAPDQPKKPQGSQGGSL
ncbi:MAG: RNA-binding protein [Cyanobacteria bacterium P01_D01_bin.1]